MCIYIHTHIMCIYNAYIYIYMKKPIASQALLAAYLDVERTFRCDSSALKQQKQLLKKRTVR